MQVDVIDTLEGFAAIRVDWDAVYAADPEAQVFLAWTWMRDWLDVHRTVWYVLAAKRQPQDTEYVAFLPLRMRTRFHPEQGFFNEIFPAGAEFSDYTNLLTRPDCEAEAIAAFSDWLLQQKQWGSFRLENLLISDRRRELLLERFDSATFETTPISYAAPSDTLDNGLCPYIDLPDTWDGYLETLSANNRQKIRRLLRKVETSEQYRITVSDSETIDDNLKNLLDLWQVKWAPSKGQAKAQEIAQRNYRMLIRAAKRGGLFLPVFWDGERPVAALATLVDECKKALSFVITGRDETYKDMPAGYLLHAFSIRHAIDHGFKIYDFLRGNESYKYLFTTQDRPLKAVAIGTRSKRNLSGKPDPRGLPGMLAIALDLQKNRQYEQAERGYRQILEVAPNDSLALFRYGRFKAELGDHARAQEYYSRAAAIEPTGDNIWFWLGKSLLALGEIEEARKAYLKVIEINPDHEEARRMAIKLMTGSTPRPAPANAAPSHIDRTIDYGQIAVAQGPSPQTVVLNAPTAAVAAVAGQAAGDTRGEIRRNSLALTRGFLTIEQTLMAWVRTSLYMISFGFALVEIFALLGSGPGIGAGSLAQTREPALIGLALITVGTVALIGATIQHRRALSSLRREGLNPSWSLAFTVAMLVAFIGIFADGTLLLGS